MHAKPCCRAIASVTAESNPPERSTIAGIGPGPGGRDPGARTVDMAET